MLGDGVDAAGLVGARLRTKTMVANGLYMVSAVRRNFEYARPMFVYFADDKISHIYDIREEAGELAQSQSIVPPPHCRHPLPRISIDLR
jgi:hypothetical protein